VNILIFIDMKKLLLIISIIMVGCSTPRIVVETVGPVEEVLNTEDVVYEIITIEPDRMVFEPYELEGSGDIIFLENRNPNIKIIEVENRIVSKQTMNLGRVVYKIPAEMKVRSTHQVVVRISKSSVHIFEELNGEVKTTVIPITETMEVKLIDPSPKDDKVFEIIPDNEGIQFVEDNESITEWTWNVTPKKSGEAKLKVVISIIRDGVKKEKVYSDDIIIKSDVKKSSWYFIRTYWEWLMSSLVLPFVIWFFVKRKKKEKGED
jgi:hypothetical protein